VGGEEAVENEGEKVEDLGRLLARMRRSSMTEEGGGEYEG